MTVKYTTEIYIKKARAKFGDDLYDYSKVIYTTMHDDIIIICKIHKEEFTIKAYNHLQNGRGCKICKHLNYAKPKVTVEQFIAKAKKQFGDKFDYSLVQFSGPAKKVLIICNEHEQEFKCTPDRHLRYNIGCKGCTSDKISTGSQMSVEEFIEKASKLGNDNIDYSKCYRLDDGKMALFCIKHDFFNQSLSSHLQGKNCKKCANDKLKIIYAKTNEYFIEKSKSIYGENKYDYSEVKYVNIHTIVILRCIIHDYKFETTPEAHYNGKERCKACKSIRISKGHQLTTEKFIERAKRVHGDKYDYSQTVYGESCKDKVLIICKEPYHGLFKQRPTDHLYGVECPKCTKCPSCLLAVTWNKGLCPCCKPIEDNVLYKKTKEWKIVKFLREQLPDEVFIHNKSVSRTCTGTDLYPDISYDRLYYFLIVEVDEFEHRGSTYMCDQARMCDIVIKIGLPCIFIRYNPDNKNSDPYVLLKRINKYLNLSYDEIVELFKNYKFGIKIDYLFYKKHQIDVNVPIYYEKVLQELKMIQLQKLEL